MNPAWSLVDADEDRIVLKHPSCSMPQPDDWLIRMTSALETIPGATMIGATRVTSKNTVNSMGELVIHPKGLHHIARGYPAYNNLFPEECDAVDGGIVMLQREDFSPEDVLKQFNEPLGSLHYCLQNRLNGGRCITVPDVIVQDDTFVPPTPEEREIFKGKWDFDLFLPDIEHIQAKYRNTELLWNLLNFGRHLPFKKYEERPFYHWHNYEKVAVFKQRTDAIVQFISTVGHGVLLDAGCGDGLFTHLLAKNGFHAMGVDMEDSAIQQAKEQTAKHEYPTIAPRFGQGDITNIGLQEQSFDSITVLDVIEHIFNPAACLREFHRLLKPGGTLFLLTPLRKPSGITDPYHVTEYSFEELIQQVESLEGMSNTQKMKINHPYNDILVAFKRSPS